MSNCAGLLLRALVTSYVEESAEIAMGYMDGFDDDMKSDPAMEYDTLYKCYKKLSVAEIKVITAAILEGFISKTLSDYKSDNALGGIIRQVEKSANETL